MPPLHAIAACLASVDRDVFWNIVSFGFQGLAGILLNVLVGRFYGAESLGILNQVLALHIVFSQLAVLGVQYSCLKYVSQYGSDARRSGVVIGSALGLTLMTNTLVTLFAWSLSGWGIGRWFDSPGVAEGWRYALLGLWCFAANKVLLAAVNGLMLLKSFAFLNSLRFALWLAALGGCLYLDVPGQRLAVLLSVGEAVLLPVIAVRLLAHLGWRNLAVSREWLREHFRFGLRGMAGGFIIEFNSRVDVILLGLFATDRAVGIYSMAALLVEGLLQVTVAIRNTYNPRIARGLVSGDRLGLETALATAKRWTYRITALGVLGCVVLYPAFLRLGLGRGDFIESWIPLCIMMVGALLASGYLPFSMLLIQAGLPGYQSLYQLVVLAGTVVFNLALIPFFGVLGAAVGMGLSFVFSAQTLRLMSRQYAGVRI